MSEIVVDGERREINLGRPILRDASPSGARRIAESEVATGG